MITSNTTQNLFRTPHPRDRRARLPISSPHNKVKKFQKNKLWEKDSNLHRAIRNNTYFGGLPEYFIKKKPLVKISFFFPISSLKSLAEPRRFTCVFCLEIRKNSINFTSINFLDKVLIGICRHYIIFISNSPPPRQEGTSANFITSQ